MVCRVKQSMWPAPYIAGSQMGQEEYSITKPFSEEYLRGILNPLSLDSANLI